MRHLPNLICLARIGLIWPIVASLVAGDYRQTLVDARLDHAFTRLNLHRVSLSVFAFNERAIRSYRRVGFVLEGRSREAIHRDGRWWDEPGDISMPHRIGLGSVAYIFMLSVLLWLVGLPLRRREWSYQKVLAFVAFTGLPAKAPSRSTTWRYSKPCSTKLCAWAAGLRLNTVARAMSPCSRRTHWPFLRSIAGKRIKIGRAHV